MDILAYLAIAVIAYLLGSISTGMLVSKAMGGPDLHKVGSGNTGATNALRTMGKKGGAIVFAGDVVKALLACLVGRLWMGQNGALLAGLFVILGHNWPVFFGFKGGKGVASMFGVATALSPISVPLLAVPFFVTLSASKMVSLSSIISAACVPVVTFVIYKFLPFLNPPLLRGDWKIPTVCTAIIAILVIFMHRSNIERIKKGEERKIGSKK